MRNRIIVPRDLQSPASSTSVRLRAFRQVSETAADHFGIDIKYHADACLSAPTVQRSPPRRATEEVYMQ